MEELLKEIIDGKKIYDIEKRKVYSARVSRGKGTKQYVIKRINLLREQLLEMKKEVLEWN